MKSVTGSSLIRDLTGVLQGSKIHAERTGRRIDGQKDDKETIPIDAMM